MKNLLKKIFKGSYTEGGVVPPAHTIEETIPETTFIDWLSLINEDYQRVHGTTEKIDVDMHQAMGTDPDAPVRLTLSSTHGVYKFNVTTRQLRELQSMHYLNLKDADIN